MGIAVPAHNGFPVSSSRSVLPGAGGGWVEAQQAKVLLIPLRQQIPRLGPRRARGRVVLGAVGSEVVGDAVGAVVLPEARGADAGEHGLQVVAEAGVEEACEVEERAASWAEEEVRLGHPVHRYRLRPHRHGVERPLVQAERRLLGLSEAVRHAPRADGAGEGVAGDGPPEEARELFEGPVALHEQQLAGSAGGSAWAARAVLVADGRLEEVCERRAARLHHVYIDEFLAWRYCTMAAISST